jgi:hypothetical protein
MPTRLPLSPAPGPREPFAQPLDSRFAQRGQRHAFRDSLAGVPVSDARGIARAGPGPHLSGGRAAAASARSTKVSHPGGATSPAGEAAPGMGAGSGAR